MRGRSLAICLASMLTSVSPAGGQAVTDTSERAALADPRHGWLFGGSLGVPGSQSEPILELFTIGIHGTQLRAPGRIGFDYSIGTMPRVLGEGVLVLGVRSGVALPVSLSTRALLLPSAGVSVIAGAGGGGGGALAGVNLGIAGVQFGTGGTGLRAGITWHWLEEARAAIWLVELGVVGLRAKRGAR